MSKAPSGRTELLTSAQAAKILNVHYRTIDDRRRRGAISGVPAPNRRGVFLYRREEIEGLKKEGGFPQARTRESKNSTVALHLAQLTASKVDQLLRVLGLDHVELGISDEEIKSVYTQMLRVLKGTWTIGEDSELHYTKQFASVTEGYMRRAVCVLEQDEPWNVYLAFFRQIALGYSEGSIMRAQIANAAIGIRQAAYLACDGRPINKMDKSFLQRVKESFILGQQVRQSGRAKTLRKKARAKG